MVKSHAFLLDQILILPKLIMNAFVMKDTFFHKEEFDLKGHEILHKYNTNIMKLQIFHNIKYDLRSHRTPLML